MWLLHWAAMVRFNLTVAITASRRAEGLPSGRLGGAISGRMPVDFAKPGAIWYAPADAAGWGAQLMHCFPHALRWWCSRVWQATLWEDGSATETRIVGASTEMALFENSAGFLDRLRRFVDVKPASPLIGRPFMQASLPRSNAHTSTDRLTGSAAAQKSHCNRRLTPSQTKSAT